MIILIDKFQMLKTSETTWEITISNSKTEVIITDSDTLYYYVGDNTTSDYTVEIVW